MPLSMPRQAGDYYYGRASSPSDHCRDDHLFIVCSLCTQVHNTSPSLSASASPFLHAAAGKARPSGSHLCSAAVAVAMALSPSRCLAQAAWVLESLLWKPERGAGSKWQAEGSEGRTLSYSADKPSSRVPSCPLLRLPSCPLSPPLLRAPVDPLTSHPHPSRLSKSPKPDGDRQNSHSLAAQAAQHPNHALRR